LTLGDSVEYSTPIRWGPGNRPTIVSPGRTRWILRRSVPDNWNSRGALDVSPWPNQSKHPQFGQGASGLRHDGSIRTAWPQTTQRFGSPSGVREGTTPITCAPASPGPPTARVTAF